MFVMILQGGFKAMQANHRSKRDAILVLAIRQSDTAAFHQLCRHYYKIIYSYLMQRTRDRDVAMDLVQDLFMALWKRRESLDETKSIQAYLYRAANNLAINHLKKKDLRQRHIIEMSKTDALHSDDNESRSRESLTEILDQLPVEQRKVLVLSRIEGYRYAEIAHSLGISVKTVESRISKAFKTLRGIGLLLLMIFLNFFDGQ